MCSVYHLLLHVLGPSKRQLRAGVVGVHAERLLEQPGGVVELLAHEERLGPHTIRRHVAAVGTEEPECDGERTVGPADPELDPGVQQLMTHPWMAGDGGGWRSWQ